MLAVIQAIAGMAFGLGVLVGYPYLRSLRVSPRTIWLFSFGLWLLPDGAFFLPSFLLSARTTTDVNALLEIIFTPIVAATVTTVGYASRRSKLHK
jgi:hypothetical protein